MKTNCDEAHNCKNSHPDLCDYFSEDYDSSGTIMTCAHREFLVRCANEDAWPENQPTSKRKFRFDAKRFESIMKEQYYNDPYQVGLAMCAAREITRQVAEFLNKEED